MCTIPSLTLDTEKRELWHLGKAAAAHGLTEALQEEYKVFVMSGFKSLRIVVLSGRSSLM
jgi:hypothetical protein